jgi:hypothetical protein
MLRPNIYVSLFSSNAVISGIKYPLSWVHITIEYALGYNVFFHNVKLVLNSKYLVQYFNI